MRLDCTGPRPRLDLDALGPAPTAEQRQALGHDHEVAVAAGAGSGKTQTLSLRYAVLLLELAVDAALGQPLRPRPEIERVLVLTFTEKAAEEMADRCYRRLLALARAVRIQQGDLDAGWGPGFGRALAAAVDHLVDTADRAAISTFHGFCARVLREHPAETATPPGFEVLEEADAAVLHDEAIEEALQALYTERPADLPGLYDAFTKRENLVAALRIALDERGRLEDRLAAHARGETRVEDWLATAEPSPDRVRDWLEGEGTALVEGVLALVAPGGRPIVDELRALAARLADLPADPLDRNALYRDAVNAFVGSGGAKSLTHHAVLGKRDDWPSGALWARHKETLQGFQRVAEVTAALAPAAARLPGPLDRVLIGTLRTFGVLALDALARLRSRLDARRALDFAELQHRAVAAVRRDPALRQRLAGRIRWLMVDEFQDTDEDQWSLVRALGRPEGLVSDRLFAVGDAKQAIYGFRGGDVTVFRGAFAEIGGQPVPLTHNFRSRDALIGWFDGLFGTVLGADDPRRPAWEAAHEPLRAGRGVAGGSVVLVPHAAGRDAAESARVEADAVARWIGAEILPGRGTYAGADLLDPRAHPTPPVALLLQRRTWQPVFEAALRSHGVPFVVARGVGFWARPEILDLVNALHAIATGDPISMLGALRSPLFCVPDTELFDHAAGHGDVLVRFGVGEPPARAGEHLRRAWARMADLRSVRDRVPVSSLLRRLISAGVAWHAWALDDDFGLAEANAFRLVDLAGRFDGRGPEGLETVADWFVRRVEEAERESEATVLPSAARVVIMTVHAAKGLEFPVVVVPQAGSSRPPRNAPLVLGRAPTGWDVAFHVPDTAPVTATAARAHRRRGKPGRMTLLDAARSTEEAAEERRLLYVAATRARDHLVVLGEVGKNGPKAGSWMALLADHHGFPLSDADGATVLPIATLLAASPSDLRVRPVLPPPPADPSGWAAVEASPEIEVSPSSLDLFAACPARWVLRHVARVPEEPTTDARGPSDWAGRLAGVRGEVIHSLLEDDVAEDEGVAAARWRARARATGCPPAEVERLLPIVLAHARRAAADPEVQALLAQEGLVEVGFRVPFGPVALRGQIDRLWREASTGEWVVVDWKSEATPQGPLVAAARHERQLRAYAWAASKVLEAHGQPPVRRGMLYFTATGDRVRYPEWSDADFADLETLLRATGEAASAPWRAVESAAIAPANARPCESCGYRGRACRGQTVLARTPSRRVV